MFELHRIRLLMLAATLSLGVAATAPAQDAVAQYLSGASQPRDTSSYEVAQVVGELSTTGTYEEPPSGQRISLTFMEDEADILTRAALDKLDADIGSLTFKDTDLADVIRFIGRKLGINFIFDSDVVQGNVTLTFKNVRVRDALDSILSSQKLAMIPDKSGIFRIVPQDRVGVREVETRTEVITLNWVAAEDISDTMAPFLSEDGVIEFNEESNVVIVTDVPPNLENIKSLISQIDLAERQVMIEARLIDVNIGALRDLGTEWSVSKPNWNWENGQTIITGIDQDTQAPEYDLAAVPFSDSLGVVNNLLEGFSVKDGNGSLAFGDSIGIFGDTYALEATFNALEQQRIVEILANPRVTTLNNVPARIGIIERIPYEEAVQGPSANSTTIEIEWERAGVEIEVKPIVTPNGFVRLSVDLAQMINRGRIAGGLSVPQIDERRADTNVIVKSGNTVVLGGLRQLNRVEGTDGVPWLYEIPLLGWLFKNKNYDHKKTELVLMMTPTIIEDAVSLTDKEKYWYDKIDADWHLPDYFFDDVESVHDM